MLETAAALLIAKPLVGVDILLRRFGARTVAAVFMYTSFKSHAKTIDALLGSLVWKDPPEPNKK